MSTIFEAHAIQINNDLLEVEVYIVHPQQFEFYTTKSFALQLIWDAVLPSERKKAPLTIALSVAQICDPASVVAAEDQYIEEVTLTQTKNYPILYEWNEMSEEEQQSFFKDKGRLAAATYQIKVTDTRWIETIEVGREWDSAACDMSRYA